MPSPGTEPTSIALYPTAADRSTLTNAHQQYYLSPPLTPYPQFPTYHESLEQTSPHLHPFRPSLPALEEMLPHETREARSPPEPQRHRQHPSAVKQSPEQGLKDIMEHNSSSTYRGEQHLTDPARILPLYSSQSHTVLPQQTSIVSPLIRRNKAHVASACVNCKKAHLACDATRPCRRCVSLDKQDSCVDVQHKRRGRPRLKDSTPSTGSLQSEHRRPSYLNRHISDDSWKLQSSSSYVRESFRRDHVHHNRSFSQGSQTHRHHPYAHPTSPAPAYAMGTNRNTSSYFDIPSPSSTAATSYGAYPAPNSPNYYPYSNSQLPGPHTYEPIPAPRSPYQSTRAEQQFSGPPTRSQPLLPHPDSSHPNLLRRGSFPSGLHQSEPGQYPQRPTLPRTGSSSAIERHREQAGDSDMVKLPSLKDLGVPFR